MRIAAVQMNSGPSISENVERIVQYIHAATRDKAGVVLFPECVVTGYRPEMGSVDSGEVLRACRQIRHAAREAHCHVLAGSPTPRKSQWFNSLLVFDPRGGETFCYDKIHLTPGDARFFTPGNCLAFFRLGRALATAIICHERRFPELVRLPVMMGAQIAFHPNAGLDTLEVSKRKRRGKDGITTRAFENQIYYVFANSVGPQGHGLWSAGDSKIVAPDSSILAQANNRDEGLICADVDLAQAGRRYAREALLQPAFLRTAWRQMLNRCRKQLRKGR